MSLKQATNIVVFTTTVVASQDGSVGVEVTEFDGLENIPNRSARGAYFRLRAMPKKDLVRVCVVFSSTLEAIGWTLDVPDYNDFTANLVQLSLARIGDHLDSGGSFAATPRGMEAVELECFSYQIDEWQQRAPASDDEIEAYIQGKLYWAGKFSQPDALFTTHDLIRLHCGLSDLRRVSQLGEHTRWTNRGAPPLGLILSANQSLLLEQRELHRGGKPPLRNVSPTEVRHFVAPTRLEEMRTIDSDKFDLRKLIRLCEELNTAFSNGSHFSVAMLVRAILDHVPPIFGVTAFAEISPSYSSARSFKESMGHLSASARKIGDSHLHIQIRQRESLPSEVQVDFSRDLDVLLSEIVRILRA